MTAKISNEYKNSFLLTFAFFAISSLLMHCQSKDSSAKENSNIPNTDSLSANSQPNVTTADGTSPGGGGNSEFEATDISHPAVSSDSVPIKMEVDESKRIEYGNTLQQLGLSTKATDSLMGVFATGQTYTVNHREAFADLHPSPGAEKWVWYAFEHVLGETLENVYWLIVATSTSPITTLTYRQFKVPYCDASEQGSYTLKPEALNDQTDILLLTKVEPLSCGTLLEGSTEVDTLIFREDQWHLGMGKPESFGELDRLDIPED